MCIYPRLIINPKYRPNKKNGGIPPKPKDKRVMMVPIGCGHCIECKRQKSNEWKVRLSEELKKNKDMYFVTLTFSEDNLKKLEKITTEEKDGEIATENEIATKAVRLFCERWRKKYEKSVKHWLITELGHDKTERLHLHGILFCNQEQIKSLEKIWNYGWVHIGSYCNERTINYIVKYVTKIDQDHPNFEGKILCSSGIGANYIKREVTLNKFNGVNTKEYYRTKDGYKLGLPIYYRNHLYTEEQREQLWINKMDKQEIYINGIRYDISTEEGIKAYTKALKQAQKDNKKVGYGGIKWKKNDYEKTLRNAQARDI